MDPRKQQRSDRPEDEPVAWFAVLERARIEGDFARAAEAQRQLERLGVRVNYRRRKPSEGAANAK